MSDTLLLFGVPVLIAAIYTAVVVANAYSLTCSFDVLYRSSSENDSAAIWLISAVPLIGTIAAIEAAVEARARRRTLAQDSTRPPQPPSR
jgi:hypothetical protein